jgi:hypothetical protein
MPHERLCWDGGGLTVMWGRSGWCCGKSERVEESGEWCLHPVGLAMRGALGILQVAREVSRTLFI